MAAEASLSAQSSTWTWSPARRPGWAAGSRGCGQAPGGQQPEGPRCQSCRAGALCQTGPPSPRPARTTPPSSEAPQLDPLCLPTPHLRCPPGQEYEGPRPWGVARVRLQGHGGATAPQGAKPREGRGVASGGAGSGGSSTHHCPPTTALEPGLPSIKCFQGPEC